MTKAELLAKADKLFRKLIVCIHPELASKFYSSARKYFLDVFSEETLSFSYVPPEVLRQKLWDIDFQSPLFNAAGMFKTGKAYYTVASQGAGAYLAGTTTYLPRRGNEKKNILHPFMPYPKSKSASNWMGLPNPGHLDVAKKLSNLTKVQGCPVGASLSLDIGIDDDIALNNLVEGLKA
mgnify:CR=1 FL=1